MLEENLTLANKHIAFLTGLTGEKLKTFGVTGKESRMMREEVKGSSDNQVITPRLGSATAENMPNLSELMSTKSKVIYFIA